MNAREIEDELKKEDQGQDGIKQTFTLQEIIDLNKKKW